ncbi:DUF962 domain-containing protein [Pelagibius sp.]|uniref:DUF962 domain-containing protein n=1 Tax=Pelagibius sp. TaxID=1931238 RepID=UPI0026316FFF|nr:DUF962 domain-containing protein [Pelagibius sp.]
MERSKTYTDFWPRYLAEHRSPTTRGLHFFGTCLGLVLLAGAVATGTWWLLVVALVCGYAFAWLAHAFVERNRPATFTHPLWSFVSDFRMLFVWLGGGMAGELERRLPDAS